MTSSPTNLLRVTYQVALTTSDGFNAQLDKMAQGIAVGQTMGTSSIPEGFNTTDYLATVLDVKALPAAQNATHQLGLIKIGYPIPTIISDMGTLLAVIFGKISMAGEIRVVDIQAPPAVAARYGGPQFGLTQIRELVEVPTGPLLMSIFKPCLGLPAETLGEMFYHQALGGVNLVKDDEILSDSDFDTARRRLAACLTAAEKAESETGRKTLYAINLTGPAEELLKRARTLVSDGATALLFNYLCYGFPMLSALRTDPDIVVPLVAHPALAGAFYGSPLHGFSPKILFGQLPRLAGADMVLYPSPFGSVALPMTDAQAISKALTQPIDGLLSSIPVPSAGITVAMVPQLIETFGNDFTINAGTGIHDFTGGSAEGAKAFAEAIRRYTALPVGAI